MNNNVLFISSSGGNGHWAVCRHLQKEAMKSDCPPKMTAVDFLKDLWGGQFGENAAQTWNNAQKRGDIRAQKLLVGFQPIADFVFAPLVHFSFSKVLKESQPHKVVLTQPNGMQQILKEIRAYEKETNRKVEIELWMTDLVTKEAVHFLKPLSNLSEKQRGRVKVFVPGNSAAVQKLFFERTGYPKSNVTFLKPEELPVADFYRDEKLKEMSPKTDKTVSFNFKLTDDQRKTLEGLGHSLENGYSVKPKESVYTMMLGSQPTRDTILKAIDTMAEKPPQKPVHLFLYCGKDEDGKPSLFKEAAARIKAKNLPSHVKIVPLPFQDPELISQTMARSDKRFTRAGGITCFEHIALQHLLGENNGRVYIVAEGNSPFDEDTGQGLNTILLKQIPVWEGGNASRLMEEVGARLSHPDLFQVHFQ